MSSEQLRENTMNEGGPSADTGTPATREDSPDVHGWQPIADAGNWLAPADKEVWTKIDDSHGERHVAKLTRYGNLWWTSPDRSKGMYVYYTPTHWKLP